MEDTILSYLHIAGYHDDIVILVDKVSQLVQFIVRVNT